MQIENILIKFTSLSLNPVFTYKDYEILHIHLIVVTGNHIISHGRAYSKNVQKLIKQVQHIPTHIYKQNILL